MSAHTARAGGYLNQLLRAHNFQELGERLEAGSKPASAKVADGHYLTTQGIERHWEILRTKEENRDALLDAATVALLDCYRGSIENFIGTVKLPVGLAGPLRINGLYAQGDYYLPLATTEAALVASYNRGAQLISDAGGCSALLLNEGVSRAPGFVFNNLRDSGQFVTWVLSQRDAFQRIAESTTRHGNFVDVGITVEGNHVYLSFEFTTGDAAGQNMVTIATEAICSYIRLHSPVQPRYFSIEANLSGDKKATALSFATVRGKKVSAEVVLPAELVQERLHAKPEQMVHYWLLSAIGGVLSGAIGVQGHYANGLAALFAACGQDIACVAEAAVGVTRLELTSRGELYASVTLPNIIVGTVGGGTRLPSQSACLEIMGLLGAGKARAFAEVCAALCLAGELSIIGAMTAGDFARAHRCLRNRTKKKKTLPCHQDSLSLERANSMRENEPHL